MHSSWNEINLKPGRSLKGNAFLPKIADTLMTLPIRNADGFLNIIPHSQADSGGPG